jgi:N-terminal domain of anti-restriction factor ArdC
MRAELVKGIGREPVPFSIDGGFMDNQTKWTELLQQAVMEPGLILRAYSAFHGYSLGNQLAAIIQCHQRGITPGPINTYQGWQKLNRQVRKGERAVWLCMPLTRKMKGKDSGDEQTVIATFVWKPIWFVMSQTDGESVPMPEMAGWDKEKALATLGIQEIPFTLTDGNVQGYAQKREVAVSPVAAMPHKTLFHELAHVELGHTAETSFTDSERMPRSLREAEAEAVSMLLCESLELPGSEYARGYIQNWLKGEVIPEKSAQKIFGAADRILRAGR